MHQDALKYSLIPELGIPTRGKVRDIYTHENTLTMVASDRISVFDCILNEPIPGKGSILTELLLYWFDKTKDIIPNHIIAKPDSNVIVVKKCKPIMIEVVVRGYLVGSLWRDYHTGKRIKCGIALPEGLQQNARLPEPIVTPTTKCTDGHDEDISEHEILERGFASEEIWKQIKETALKLYKRGQELLDDRGLILVDTKYEFGLDSEGNLLLIDEIHTPDSSRFLYKKDYDNQEMKFPDKEFLREWLRENGFTGNGPIPPIPEQVRLRVFEGYKKIYETITGQQLSRESCTPSKHIIRNLKNAGHIKGVFALIVADEEGKSDYTDSIESCLKKYQIPVKVTNLAGNSLTKTALELIDQYNQSLEPMVCITVSEKNHLLSEMISGNLRWPVIACPPKIGNNNTANSPASQVTEANQGVTTVIDAENAAYAAVKILKTMELAQ